MTWKLTNPYLNQWRTCFLACGYSSWFWEAFTSISWRMSFHKKQHRVRSIGSSNPAICGSSRQVLSLSTWANITLSSVLQTRPPYSGIASKRRAIWSHVEPRGWHWVDPRCISQRWVSWVWPPPVAVVRVVCWLVIDWAPKQCNLLVPCEYLCPMTYWLV